MKPVYQNTIDQGTGDCTAACIASILEVPLESIPNFNLPNGSHYWINVCKWCKENNYSFINFWFLKNWVELEDLPYQFQWAGLNNAHCIISIPSQKYKDGWHHVVAKMNYETENFKSGTVTCEIVHDPNKGNKPYKQNIQVRSVSFLLKNN